MTYLRGFFQNEKTTAAFMSGEGGAKGITFSNILHKHNIHVDGIIDINPAKQGKYIGFSGTKIQSPEETGKDFCNSNIFIMNPVYTEEIRETISAFKPNLIRVT